MADETIVKVCSGCNQEKPASAFFTDKRRKYGLFSACRSCTSTRNKERRSADPERFRAWERASSQNRFEANGGKKRYRGLLWRLKNKFGITIDDFLQKLRDQGGKCAICSRAIIVNPSGKGSRDSACVDHDHETGKVRGILCQNCNTAIGLLGDNPATVFRASQYLREHKGESSV